MGELKPDGRETINVCVGFLFLATISTFGRFAVRFKINQPVLLTDYFMLGGWFVFAAYCVAIIAATVKFGGTVDIYYLSTVSLSDASGIFKTLTATELVYVLDLTLIKLSVLLLYVEIFSILSLRRAIYGMMGVCVAWFIATLLATIFQCSPIGNAWEIALYETSKCLSYPTLVFGIELSNALIDVMILVLPLNQVRKLQMSRAKKLGVALVFLLGGGVVITSICRMAFTYQPGERAAQNFPRATDWSTVQLGSAVICGCLPCLPPLIPDFLKQALSRFSTRLSRKSRPYEYVSENSNQSSHKAGGYADLDGRRPVARGVARGGNSFSDDIPLNQVVVRSNIEVERE